MRASAYMRVYFDSINKFLGHRSKKQKHALVKIRSKVAQKRHHIGLRYLEGAGGADRTTDLCPKS
jgi:hypothetical protein